jgi:hypothetical protein
MSIQITTSSRKVNRYSDFTLVMSLTKNGASYIPPAFILVFYVDSWDDCCHRYVASCLDGVYTNCKVDKGTISVFFDGPEFNVGQLKCRVLDIVDNADYSDGTLDTCTPITLPVEIVAGAGDTDTIVLGYGTTYFGDNHDLVFEGVGVSIGDDNNLII